MTWTITVEKEEQSFYQPNGEVETLDIFGLVAENEAGEIFIGPTFWETKEANIAGLKLVKVEDWSPVTDADFEPELKETEESIQDLPF